MTKTKLEEEHVPACLVCGKLWQRKDSKKCWLFEKTGEKRAIKSGEWGVVNTLFPEPYHWDFNDDCREFSILKLTEFSSNPFEPIKEVAELAETALTAIELLSLETRKWDEYKDLYKLAKAISECMKRMGEK